MKRAFIRRTTNSIAGYNPRFFMHEMKKGTEEAEYADQNFSEFVKGLSELIPIYRSHIQSPLPEEYRLSPIPNSDRLQNTVRIAAFLYRRLANEVATFQRNYFEAAVNHITSLLSTMKMKRQLGISVHCAVEQVNDYFMSQYEPKCKCLFAKLLSLKSYILKNVQIPRSLDISINDLQTSLLLCSQQVIDAINYSPFCSFDEQFSFFVLQSQAIPVERFDEIVDQITQTVDAKSIDLTRVNEIVRSCVELLKPKTNPEVSVIKFAVYRFLFDRLYLKYPHFISDNKADSQHLSQVCSRVRWLTPREMSIPEKMLKPGMMDISFTLLVQRSPQLQKAVSYFSKVQFLTNPIDVIANVFLALKSGEDFVKQNSFETRFGPYVSMFDPNKISTISDQLSFDDFFPLFCLIFAMACPVNVSAIVTFTLKLKGIVLLPALDFAKLFLSSTLEYMKTVNVEEIAKMSEPVDIVENEEEDPLGLSHLKARNSPPKLSLLLAD